MLPLGEMRQDTEPSAARMSWGRTTGLLSLGSSAGYSIAQPRVCLYTPNPLNGGRCNVVVITNIIKENHKYLVLHLAYFLSYSPAQLVTNKKDSATCQVVQGKEFLGPS
ncbi:serum response factor-binding protein 1 [Platysternon megacephalum]|uniref:Serum response factor-binding protein 1 n=1 Tax=Platysternon megacephalum TaxID=55544 RepID=A0A4D9EQN1_9SAUR|nr:serum response factor-binding protein 1 [Platysternon megacephalum]